MVSEGLPNEGLLRRTVLLIVLSRKGFDGRLDVSILDFVGIEDRFEQLERVWSQ